MLGAAAAKDVKAVLLSETGAVLAEGTVDSSGVYAIQAPRGEFEKKLGAATSARLVFKDAAGSVLSENIAEVRAGLQGVALVNVQLSAKGQRPEIQLERIRELDAAKIAKLKKSDIRDVRALVTTPVESVAKVLGVPADQARTMMRRAAVLLVDE